MWKTNLPTFRTMIREALRLRRSVLAGAVLVLVGQPAPAGAQVGCGSQIGPGETVTLEADLSCPGETVALTVMGPATLDLNGHRIRCGNPNDGSIGISVLEERARVRNGSVEECFVGVVVSGTGNHDIENVVARDTCDSGFVVAGAAGNRLTGNVSRNAGGADGCTVAPSFGRDGFTINGARNALQENFARDPEGDGIHVNGGQNRLTRNAVSNPDGDGFEITGTASDNRLSDNLVLGRAGCGDGFDVDGSDNRLDGNIAAGCEAGFDVGGTGNSLRLNRTIGSGSVGYDVSGDEHQLTTNAAFGDFLGFIVGTDRSRLTRNTASGNTIQGMLVGGGDNQISRGTALGNDLDLQEANVDCGSNQWSRNTFQTSADPDGLNPPCIE